MGEKVEAAVACFREGFSCSQAILATYGDDFGLPRETALRAAAALGAGMGRLGEVCGAVAGALIVIGLKHGHTEATDKETKEKNYALVRDFSDRFRSRNGALCCRELLGCDLTTAEGVEEARQKGLFAERCPCFVRDAAEILEDVL
jgi:C_GCAxxG_C_C family probable redox protein